MGLLAISSIFALSIYSVKGQSVNKEKASLALLQEDSAEIQGIVNEIYSKHIKEIGNLVKAAIVKRGKNSVENLSAQSKETIELTESQMTAEMRKNVLETMNKYGWERIEESGDE